MKKSFNSKIETIFLVAIFGLILVMVPVVMVVANSPQQKLKNIGYSDNEVELIFGSVGRQNIDRYIAYSSRSNTSIENIILVLGNDADGYEFSYSKIDILTHPDFDQSLLDNYMAYRMENHKAPIDAVVFLANKGINKKYDPILIDLVEEKYFIMERLERYLDYFAEYPGKNSFEVVRAVNSNTDIAFYSETRKTDIGHGILMLVNQLYRIGEDFSPNLVSIDSKFTFGFNLQVEEMVYDAFLQMTQEAERSGIRLGIISAFRSFAEQERFYNDSVRRLGLERGEMHAARAGHSEHHTGLVVDIRSITSPNSLFENTREFVWLQENAHRFGFILRYPKGKEFLTGYNFESWHWRFVGTEVATYIFENDIIFEEYHAFYIANRQ